MEARRCAEARDLRAHVPRSGIEGSRGTTPRSTCRNLAEGYKRFQPAEFANFTRYSAASNAEVRDVLDDGLARGYWTEDEIARARTLVSRVAGAVGSLQRYLRSPRARRNAAAILRSHSLRDEPAEQEGE